jgi:hypothetical protein
MKRASSLKVLATSLLLFSLAAPAEERGYWRAASQSARTITGDITLADERLTINFSTTTISRIRALEPAELSAIFDTDASSPIAASLYRLNIPASKKFIKRNSLCGSEDIHWMVAYAQGNSLQLAFFSGDKPPVFTFDAMAASTDKCGTFTYAR